MRNTLRVAAVALLLLLSACTGGGTASKPAPEPNPPGTASGQPAPAISPQLQQDLAQLDAYAVPAGVDPAQFAMLKLALRQALLSSGAAAPATRSASCMAPFQSQVVSEGGVDYLEWLYTNSGDYDLNGDVGLSDLVPLAKYFHSNGFAPGSIQAWVDGDSNGEVNLSDLLPIGRNYHNAVDYFQVYRHPVGQDPVQWAAAGQVQFNTLVEGLLGSRGFKYQLEADHAGYTYAVAPRHIETGKPFNEIGGPDTVPAPTSTVSGQVKDSDGKPVANVNIVVGPSYQIGGTAVTDAQGFFAISAIPSNGNTYVLTANKPGYAAGTKTVLVPAGRSAECNLTLLRRTPAASVSAVRGGSALHSNMQVTLPPNGLVHADGTALTGSVSVNLTYIDPHDPIQVAAAPGDMSARQQDFSTVRLATYGMAEVYLDDGSAQPANLAPGQTATLTFPIAAADQASAPPSIGLYSFDTTSGMWQEEGSASKNDAGTAYVAQVGHFSYWNCDRPVHPTHIAVQVTDAFGTPVPDAVVTSAGVSYQGTTYQSTPDSGKVVFSVEQSAVERESVDFMGLDLGGPQDINTPDQDFEADAAPLVATFRLPPSGSMVTFNMLSAAGNPVPYATVYFLDASGTWERQTTADANGLTRLWLANGSALKVWASYGTTSSAPQDVTVGSGGGQQFTVTLGGVHVPPVARFKIAINSTPDDLAPLSITADASTTAFDAPLSFYHWQVFDGYATFGTPLAEATTTTPLWNYVVDDAGHHTILLTVTDQAGQSDQQSGSVCSY